MQLTDNIQDLQQGLNQEVLLHRITNQIRQSLELQEILTATVAEIRSFLGTDRVIVYRFHANGSGKVIAESINENRLPSLLGLNFPADDIPPYARERFLKTRQRSVVNVATHQMGVSPLECSETGKPLTTTEIQYRTADPCHIQYLKAMGVQCSLVVPILHHKQLWGLLISHHSEPRFVTDAELLFVQRVADEVSIAIAQSTLLSHAREQAQREATINRVTTLLHALQTPPLQTALADTVVALQGCGGRLYIAAQNQNLPAELYQSGTQPATDERGQPIEQHPLWQEGINRHLQPAHPEAIGCRSNAISVITDIYNEVSLESFIPAFRERGIRSLLIVPLTYRQQSLGYLTIFSQEIHTETWWAGRFDPNNQQLQPRQSFEAWRELKSGQPRNWTVGEVELMQALGHQFSIAIHQHQLYQQVQVLNTSLEHQVKQRTDELQLKTEELQQSLESARVLKQVTNQIRSTLELPTILQTIVREVRELLNTDRVIVYQFLETWSGKVVVEEVIDEKLSILGQVYEPNCFPVEYTYQYRAGRVRAISNIQEAGLSICHVEFLQKINVQANLVVPIRRGDEHLWGLLVAHECRTPRVWQAAELDLLQQLADQAAIAIHQAELYEKSCTAAATATEKAQQLESALDELQITQTQLIQTEKMSSLGQLVAGIAHEINNPVNFIYGNLTYVGEYVEDVLKLLELYQEEFTHPSGKILKQMESVDLEFLAQDLPKTLASMKGGADRIRQLVLSLRTFSRLEEAESKRVNIHEGLDSTLLILQHRLTKNSNSPDIQVIRDYGNLPLVECYASQMNQVFMNIVSNAIDALEQRDATRSPEEMQNSPSQITIQTSMGSGDKTSSIIIRIADNGPGMTDSVKARIFNPFFTTKPVGKGTGLGLSISYQIVVAKHGGTLKCNTQLGQGSEFLIELPIKSATRF